MIKHLSTSGAKVVCWLVILADGCLWLEWSLLESFLQISQTSTLAKRNCYSVRHLLTEATCAGVEASVSVAVYTYIQANSPFVGWLFDR